MGQLMYESFLFKVFLPIWSWVAITVTLAVLVVVGSIIYLGGGDPFDPLRLLSIPASTIPTTFIATYWILSKGERQRKVLIEKQISSFKTFLDCQSTAILIQREDFSWYYVSDAYQAQTGLSSIDDLKDPLHGCWENRDAETVHKDREVLRDLPTGVVSELAEPLVFRKAMGDRLYFKVTSKWIENPNGEGRLLLNNLENITELVAQQQRIQDQANILENQKEELAEALEKQVELSLAVQESNQALIDSLLINERTGLPNYRGIKHLYDVESTTAQIALPGQPDARGSLFLFALPKFSEIQQMLSLEVAAQFIVGVAELIKQCLRKESVLTQISADQFCIFTHADKSMAIQDGLLLLNRSVVEIAPYKLPVDSVLIEAPYNQDSTLDEALSRVFLAYQDALRLKRPFHRYEPGLTDRRKDSTQYAGELERALENGEFELFFQPKYSLQDGARSIIGAESLIRWNHPADGLLTPAQFIDIVENSNARRAVSEFVIRNSVKAFCELRDLGFKQQISLNLSSYDLTDLSLYSVIDRLINENAIGSRDLQLEVLESDTSHDVDTLQRAIAALKVYDVSIALDDFGTGRSSLSYISKLPIDTLKIDRSFIQDIDSSEQNQIIVESIVEIAGRFGWKVVAEGIEREEEAQVCTRFGVEVGQGYLLSRPLRFSDYVEKLEREKSSHSV